MKRSFRKRYNSEDDIVDQRLKPQSFETDDCTRPSVGQKQFNAMTENPGEEEVSEEMEGNEEAGKQERINERKDRLFFEMYKNFGMNVG